MEDYFDLKVPPMTARQEGVANQRFRITWDNVGGRYTVNIPCYDGGEVVRAEAVDLLVAEVARLREALQYLRVNADDPALVRRVCDEALGGGS